MDIKNDITERAEALFLKYGFRSVTMDDIARELGISKKTLYQHFTNKDDLVETVVKNHIEKEHIEIGRLISGAGNALDEMFRVAKMYIEQMEGISPSAVFDLQKYYGKLWEYILKEQDEFDISFIIRNIKRGRKEGYYRKNMEAEIVAKIFNKSTHMVVNEMANRNPKFSRKKLVKELHDYHVRSIATPKGLAVWEKLFNSI